MAVTRPEPPPSPRTVARSISLEQIVGQCGGRLGLEWILGQAQQSSMTVSGAATSGRPSLVGYLNLIHPNRIQVIGQEELEWLDALEARARWEALAKVADARPAAIIIGGHVEVARDLEQAASEHNIPLLKATQPAWEVVQVLAYEVSRALAPGQTVHGVFMEIFTLGVLITGEAGTGKSELALELISRGHRLIADDAPSFTRISPDLIEGHCPEVLRDYLEVRGLGLLDVRRMFGDAAVKTSKYLRLVIHLHTPSASELPGDRLQGHFDTRPILELDVPRIHLPVLAGRNLAVMAEAAVRSFMLRLKGFDAAREFMERHARLMSEQT